MWRLGCFESLTRKKVHMTQVPAQFDPMAMFDLSAEEAQDMLFHSYFEGDLSPREAAEFESRLEQDARLHQEYQSFVLVMDGLRQLPFEFAPDDFVETVQSRIRARSRGRFFAESYFYKARVPYEVIAVVMIVVMGAAYMMMDPNTREGALVDDVDVKVSPK